MRKTSITGCKNSILCKIALITMLLFPAMNMLQAGALSAKPITGTVKSATDGEPLIGATVQVQGHATTGALTDVDGHFTVEAEQGQTLVVSYVGFVTQNVKVTGSDLTIVMQEESNSIEDVVVIGYGVQKKKLVTGATAQVKGDDIAKLNTSNPLQAMQGQTPGVSITTTSSQPGSSMKVSIRGLGTTGNAAPLYLIDGVGGDISTLNPADIESIDVLKDAASAAIYGAQAANGVVLITTKSGKEGRTVVSFDGYYGIQKVARKPSLLNADEYKTIMDEYALNTGSAANDWSSMASTLNSDGSSVDTDWFDQVTVNNAKMQSYNIGVTGGTKTNTFAMSLGYLNQEGLVGGSGVNDYNRYNFRMNSETKLFNDIVKVGEHASLIYNEKHGVSDFSDGSGNAMYSGSAVRAALGCSPVNPVYGKNDYNSPYFSSAYSDWNIGDGNPLGNLLNSTNKTKNWTADVNAYVQIEPIKNLILKTVFGISANNSSYRSYTPPYSFDSYTNKDYDEVSENKSNGLTMVWTNTAAYSWNIGEHSFNALLGCESSRYDGDWLSAAKQNLRSGFDSWYYAWLSNANTQSSMATGLGNDPTRTMSYFGRLGWSWKDTYMINATLRADGSSKFASGHRWGWFPSVSAGWTISNEQFFSKVSKNIIDYLKLRASWGQVGNQNVDSYQYLATLASNAYYNYGNNTTAYGTYPQRTANDKLTWETSEQLNIGLDARFLSGRLATNFDFYVKTTKDWLVNSPTYATTGFDYALINGGNVKNTGFEFNLTWNDMIGKDFQYNIGFNGAFNHNNVTDIPTNDGIIHGSGQILSDDATEIFRAQNGHTMGYFWGYKTAGIFQNKQEISDWVAAGNGVLQTNVQPGDVKYVDVDHNGVINDDDKVDLGNGVPKFTFGINLGFSYKHFDFSTLLSGATGFRIMQAYHNYTSAKANWTTAVLQRWTGEGTSNSVPRISSKASGNYEFSDLFLQKGDYMRISNVTLGYDFAPLLAQKWLSQARLYFQVQNLYCFTKYDGMDPEVGFGYYSWVSGMDLGSYPRPRTYLVGVNIKF
jgi:TonB-linked SusC/RagA family outer membrane protein